MVFWGFWLGSAVHLVSKIMWALLPQGYRSAVKLTSYTLIMSDPMLVLESRYMYVYRISGQIVGFSSFTSLVATIIRVAPSNSDKLYTYVVL